ncbi:MAG: C40 family peptidase [Patescibacteria group bacterium]|nr:C40 family peptidase [Patescibacteria group bacterium]
MDANTAKKIIEEARSLLGTPYKYGVKDDDIPRFVDCSSFTQLDFLKVLGKDIGRSTILQATQGEAVLEKNLQPGDLIFFRGSKGHFNDNLFPPEEYGYDICIGHVAIYTGNGMAIHASGEKGMVIEEPLEDIKKTRVRIVIIKRL